jgi:hypothetical protein
MTLPIAGILASLAALVLGLQDGNPFLLIGALVTFALSLFAVDYVTDRNYERAIEDLNHAGAYRVGYEEDAA